MMTYTCEYSTNRHAIKQTFENTDFKLPGTHGWFRPDIQAFCGKRAAMNQERVFHSYWGNVKVGRLSRPRTEFTLGCAN